MNQDTKHRLEHYFRHRQAKHSHQFRTVSKFTSHWLSTIRPLGFSPVVIIPPKSVDQKGVHRFEFRLFSFSTFYSIISTLFVSAFLGYWTHQLFYADVLHSILKEFEALTDGKFEEYVTTPSLREAYANQTLLAVLLNETDPLTQISLQIVAMFAPMSGFHYIIASLMSTPYLLKFLEGVNEFEIRIQRLCPELTEVSLAQLVRFRIHAIGFNAFITILFCGFQFHYQWRIFPFVLMGSKLALGALILFPILAIGLFDDTKALFILKTVEEQFQQINDGIAIHQDRRKRGACKELTLEDIRNWRILILLAREQVKLGWKAIEGATSSALIGISVVLTISIYLGYASAFKNSPKFISRFAYGTFFFCSILFLRVYVKAALADGIIKKERTLANALRQLIVNPVDTKYTKYTASASSKAIQLEISFIADAIAAKPSKCVLQDVMPLKVSSMFGIFQSIFTYAVALILFDSVMFQKE